MVCSPDAASDIRSIVVSNPLDPTPSQGRESPVLRTLLATTMSKRTVLITGCSDGGMGAALALGFQAAGLQVIATARDASKMRSLERAGIQTMALDIQSETSVQECIGKISSLDILVNNAGVGLQSPVSDMSIAQAKKLFDVNLWAQIAMIQACLPLLLKSKQGIVVNHGSGELPREQNLLNFLADTSESAPSLQFRFSRPIMRRRLRWPCCLIRSDSRSNPLESKWLS